MSAITQSLAVLKLFVDRLFLDRRSRKASSSAPFVLLGDGVVPADASPEGYLPWLLSQGCLTCGDPSPYAAYVKSPQVGGEWRDVVPLCIGCHALRRAGWRKLKEETGWDYSTLLMTAHDLAKQWATLKPIIIPETSHGV